VKPESRHIQMSKKHFECVLQAMKTCMVDVKGTKRIHLELQDVGYVTIIHGLSVTEIDAAEDEIKAYMLMLQKSDDLHVCFNDTVL